MKVTLLSTTPNAAELLIFTKATRLNMNADLMIKIQNAMGEQEKLDELAYMADTIPSSWEFVDYVFLVEGVSRAYTHQQVRTRAGSYAQQSMRVVDMDGFKYIFTRRNKESTTAMLLIHDTLGVIKRAYRDLLDMGQPTEDARGILPTNIATNIVCKFNLRTLSELARSRTGGRTQQEYQDVVNAMIDRVLEVHPWADKFLFVKSRDYFEEIEAFAEEQFGGDLKLKGKLLKIVDRMRNGA